VNTYSVSLLILVALCLLGARYFIYEQQRVSYVDGQEISVTERLNDIPEVDGRFQRFALSQPAGPKLFITTSRYPEYHYGDVLAVFGDVEKKDYEGYSIFTMSYPKLQLMPSDNIFYSVIAGIREQISAVFAQTLPPISASLLMGIVFGIKEQMPQHFEDALRITGVMHVIAASGMNVSMVAGAVFLIASTFINRRKAIVLSLGLIIFYSFLTGFEASIVRATIMAGIAFTASYVGRQYYGFLALVLTAYIMLIFHPGYLSDAGFQLSFLATLGILYISPPKIPTVKEKSKKRTRWYQGVVDDVAVTVAAQIATLPFLLFAFGQYGLLSIPVNALILWTIPILMILGSIAALCSLILPLFAKPFLYLALPFLLYFESIVSEGAKLGMVFTIGKFSWTFVGAYYLLLMAIVITVRKGRERKNIYKRLKS
jgi:competence protein ComEC